MRERDLIQLAHTLGSAIMFGSILLGGTFRRRRDNHILAEELERAKKRERYLATMIDNSDIEVDEFDLIALSNM